jgi:hypothetical protein
MKAAPDRERISELLARLSPLLEGYVGPAGSRDI